ncbi:MAG: CRTAC1 family protein, partial [Anaerolineae bacterium]|nr:CRTAC1 family protein [Anaerolineae bacterium]
MAWADLDADGDLDLVTGSYDAGLLSDLGNSFLLNKTGGIFVYKNDHGNFRAVPLAGSAQAMAIQLFDADRDGRPDLVVGNDFNVPDYLWLRRDDGWERSRFDATSHSTMSLDAGDIDNDGVPELFSSDMMPYDDSPATVAAWAPMMASMVAPHEPDDPQVMSNVLQIYTGVTGYQNAARQRGVDATGWTWSAKFGDLDRDGLLDLYAVNGFIESTIFAALPNHELVEENQALRNLGDGRFRPQPAWRLNSTASGRGMAMADLDGDGDLDIVVNNLRAPAQLFENGLCGGDTLQVDLRWPGSGNTQAIGATVALHTDAGTFWRDVRSGSGYLSGDPPRLHFGFPAGARLQSLEIRWPDGAVSYLLNPTRAALLTVTRP